MLAVRTELLQELTHVNAGTLVLTVNVPGMHECLRHARVKECMHEHMNIGLCERTET